MSGDFPGGSAVKNPSCNARDASSVPGQGTKIPHATGQLRPHAPSREPMCPGARVPQLERENPHEKREKTSTTREKTAHRNERAHVPQLRPNAAKNK